MKRRIDILKEKIIENGLDGYLVLNEVNMFYLIGFRGGSRLLIPKDGKSVLYVSKVNYEAAKDSVKTCTVQRIDYGEDIDKVLRDQLIDLGLRKIGFDVMDAQTYIKNAKLQEKLDFYPKREILWSMRQIKDSEELYFIKKAAEITSKGMKRALEIVDLNKTEKEVVAEIEYELRRNGADGIAFETIVASGPNSAYPHGGSGNRKLQRGDLIVIDLGAKSNGYCSDMTRTIVLGNPSPRQLKIFEIVKEAQQRALKALKEGVAAKNIDAIARDFIVKKGFGENFVHGLGHGVGLEVHEPPTLSPISKDQLKNGNVVTVEPGIYIPGLGGVRIEDTVAIIHGESEVLTSAPYTLKKPK